MTKGLDGLRQTPSSTLDLVFHDSHMHNRSVFGTSVPLISSSQPTAIWPCRPGTPLFLPPLVPISFFTLGASLIVSPQTSQSSLFASMMKIMMLALATFLVPDLDQIVAQLLDRVGRHARLHVLRVVRDEDGLRRLDDADAFSALPIATNEDMSATCP